MTDTALSRARGVVEAADRVPTSREELADRLRVLREAIEFKDRFTRAALSEAAVEELARVIDPSSWRVFDGYLADVKRKYRGKNAGYDPDAFKDKKSMALVRAVLTRLSEMAEGAK